MAYMTQKTFGTHAAAAIPAPTADIVETFHGVTVADPFRPLEDAEAPATQAFISAQNARTAALLAPQANYIAAETEAMRALMDYPRRSLPSHYGLYWFRTFNSGLDAQPRYEVAESPNGPWRTLLDPLALDASGVTAISDFSPSEDGTLIAYSISVGGDDMTTLYVLETATGRLLPDKIENCRWAGPCWNSAGTGFYYSHTAGDASKRRVVKYHALGTDSAADTVLFMHEHPESIAHFERRRQSGIELISVRIGTDKNTGFWWRAHADYHFEKLIEPQTENISIVDLIDGRFYAVSTKNNPRGELITFTADKLAARSVLVPAAPAAVMTDAWIRDQKLFVAYSDDTASRIDRHQLDGSALPPMPIPPQSMISFAHDNKDDTGTYISISSYLTPGTKYYYDYRTNVLTFFEKSDAPQTLEDCVVERVQAKSHDGTLVPMTIIRHPSCALDGTAALRLYGYGGFNISLTPAYSPLRIARWVQQGGIFVIANLRGGGEYGDDWYNGGRLLNKMNSFHDFAACATWLIDNNYTKAARLVTEGGSNGGLLTLATMQLYPQLFGAVISHVPVTDMLRFDLHTYGAYWKSDYGDPKNSAADFAVTMRYSPLHTIKSETNYPPHLLLTADKDTRVVPMHALKYVAAMQAANPGAPCYLRVEVDAGHGAGTALQKTIAESALINGFCQHVLGPIHQAAFRESQH